MKQKFLRIVSKVSMFLTASTLVFSAIAPMAAHAADFASVKDVLTNLTLSETADHTFTIVMPSGDNWALDEYFLISFPTNFIGNSTSTNWVAGDLTYCDGTTAGNCTTPTYLTPDNIDKTSGSITDSTFTCTTTSDTRLAVSVPTNGDLVSFGVKKCSAATEGAGANGATIKFNFFGTSTTGSGTLTNTTTAGSKVINIDHYNSSNALQNELDIAVGIVDNDAVTASANVDPTISFDIDTSTTDTEVAVGTGYVVTLGTLSTTAWKTSGANSDEYIFLDLATNASGGAVVTVIGANGGLLSTANSYTIDGITDETTVSVGTEAFGLCVSAFTSTSGAGTATKGTNYDADGSNCTTTTSAAQRIGQVYTSAQVSGTNNEIITTGGGTLAGGRATIDVKASASTITPAADDYTETLTFIATATF